MKNHSIHDTLSSAYENTVPRRMVHRAVAGEVFLTGAARCDELHFQCAVQLPRAHSH